MTTFAAKPGAPAAGEWHRPTALEGVAATGSRIMTARLTADDRADLLAAAEESLDRLAHLSAPQATVPASGSASRQPAAWPRR